MGRGCGGEALGGGGGGHGMKAFFWPDVGAPQHHPTFCTGLEHRNIFPRFQGLR